MTVMLLMLVALVAALAVILAPHLHVLLAYSGSNTTPTANFDLSALADADFSSRGSTPHYIFSEDYQLAYLIAQSTTMTDARLQSPTFAGINADGLRITAFQRKAGLGGTPTLADRFLGTGTMLPRAEEVQAQASCTGAAERQQVLLSLVPPNWNAQIPAGNIVVMEGTVASFTPAANVWSGPQTLTLTSNPRGGVYAVVRVTCQQVADTFAFRVIFPRHPFYKGRKLRPGWVAQNAIGDFDDVITQINPFHLGTWGWFHSFELPTVEVLASTSAAMTPIFRLWCVYLGRDEALLNSIIAQNSVA